MLIDPRGYRIKRRIAKQITDRDKIPFTRLSGKFVLAQPLFRSCPFSRETPCVAIRLKGVENPLRRTHFRETYRSPEARAGALPALSIVYVAFLRPSISSAARLLPLPSTRFHLFVFLFRVLLLLPLFSFFFFCLLPFSLSERLSSLVSSWRFLVARDRFHQRGVPPQPAASSSRSPTKQAKTVRRAYTYELTE